MKNTSIKLTIITTLASSILLSPVMTPAFAQSVTPGAKKAALQQNRIPTLIPRGDTEITKRITSLNNAISKIQGAKKLSDSEKQTLVSNDQNVISTLNTLKTKIDADTDISTLRTDLRSIFDSVRVYMLVLPQEAIVAAADRQLDVTGDLNSLADKLSTRISDAQSKGKDVTSLQTSLTDMKAKISDATTQANAAVNGVINLKPDQGDAGIIASNKQAITTARAAIKAGETDIQTAYNDAKSIVTALKAM